MGDYGWKEIWYNTKDNIAQVYEAIDAFTVARGFLAGWGVQVDSVFVRDAAVPRSGVTRTARIPLGDPKLPCDVPTTAFVGRFSAGEVAKRVVILRGVPDTWTVFKDRFSEVLPEDIAYENFIEFAKVAAKQGFQFRAPSITGVNGTGLPIRQWILNGGMLAIHAPGIEYIRGRYYLVAGVKGMLTTPPRQVNARWRCMATQADVMRTQYGAVSYPDYDWYVGGRIYPRVTDYFTITKGDLVRVTVRKTGTVHPTHKGRKSSAKTF